MDINQDHIDKMIKISIMILKKIIKKKKLSLFNFR